MKPSRPPGGSWPPFRVPTGGLRSPRSHRSLAAVAVLVTVTVVALAWVILLDRTASDEAVVGPVFHRLDPRAIALGLVLIGLVSLGCARWWGRRSGLEQALHQSESRFSLVLEHADLGIIFTDAAGVVRFASRGAEQLFARPSVELVGRRFRSLCTEDSGISDDSLHGTKPPGETRTLELDGLRPDGTSFPMELVVRRVELDGETLALMQVRDISQRRRNDLELRRKNEFISTILENLPLALTVNTIDEGDLLYVNPVFEQAYGWPRGGFESVDDAFLAMLPDPVERASVRRRIVSDVMNAGARPCKWDNVEITTAAGERRFITAVGIPLFGQNLVIAAAQDVTEARRNRISLAERERLAAVGELAAGIAHDFNNLLQVVVMNTELALAASRRAPEISRYLEMVLGQSVRGADLIRQILDFARETALELHPMELEPIIAETLAAVRSTLGERVEIELVVAAEKLRVEGDPTRIQQLVSNLLINASDAMPRGGRVQLGLHPLDLTSGDESPVAGMPHGRWICLEVADEGVGMTSEVVSRVFEPFFTTKPRTRGTGLGLALVYGIVAQHRGYIGVRSAPGRGTTFTVYLPRVEAKPEGEGFAGGSPERAPRGAGETILVVEDDDAIREVACQGLELLGYRVVAVSDGAAAFETLEASAGAADVVLSDLVMPGIDGTRLAREVRSRWPDVRIVLMTGFAPDHDSGERLAAGIAACLHKPFTLSELARTITHVLSQPAEPLPDESFSPDGEPYA